MLLRCILGIVGSRNIECVQFFYLILFYTDFFIPPDFNEARYWNSEVLLQRPNP